MSAPNTPYVSNGEVLQSPPLSARVIRFLDNVYFFLGLYFVSLFSVCNRYIFHPPLARCFARIRDCDTHVECLLSLTRMPQRRIRSSTSAGRGTHTIPDPDGVEVATTQVEEAVVPAVVPAVVQAAVVVDRELGGWMTFVGLNAAAADDAWLA
ncbi:hypothetical protein M432DRAFT_330262 [Thermoascus aurantiacus ATCC 26904]